MGTNPLSIAFPNPQGDPYLLDMATSALAANKAREAIDGGRDLKPGVILDAQGEPSTDPRDLIERQGMLLPLGGSQGHKGFGLGVMVDFFSGILGGAGTAIVHDGLLNNGTFLIAIDPGAFVDAATYAEQARALATYLRETRTPHGAPPVMLPGEYESRNRRARMESGIALEDAVWKSIRAVLAELKVAEPWPIA
jgi:LDH2 family malate/lactate/ureidoglycolate dehydrogenase